MNEKHFSYFIGNLILVAVIGFSQLQYSTEEFSREVVITVELLHGTLASSIEILLLTSDGTAKSNNSFLLLFLIT